VSVSTCEDSHIGKSSQDVIFELSMTIHLVKSWKAQQKQKENILGPSKDKFKTELYDGKKFNKTSDLLRRKLV
jgi:hypothetical protein